MLKDPSDAVIMLPATRDAADAVLHMKGYLHEIQGFIGEFKQHAEQGPRGIVACLDESHNHIKELLGSLACACVESDNPDPLTRSGPPVAEIQVLLREQGVLDAVLELIQVTRFR